MIRRCLLLATVVMLVAAPTAAACSCAMFDPDRIDDADAVVVGMVVDIDDGLGFVTGNKVTRVRVERSLGGTPAPGSTISVISAGDGAACGLELDEGDRAGLLLDEDGDRWSGSLCATSSAARLAVELDRLDPPRGVFGRIAATFNAFVAHIEDAPMRYYQSEANLEAATASKTSDVASVAPVGDAPCLRRA